MSITGSAAAQERPLSSRAGTMACGSCDAPGRFALVERPVPEAAPDGWVLLDIAAVGLCGTDYHIYQGKHPFLAYPRVIGHELSARVAESAGGWNAGQLVVVNPYIACGACRPCRLGRPNCCERLEVLGVHRDGGLCRRIAVPAQNLYPAGGLSPIAASMVEFLAIGAHAVARSAIDEGKTVLVVGMGPIGIGTALFAKLSGASVTLHDTSPERLEAAMRVLGADVRPLEEEIPAEGFDAVFDATGNIGAMEKSFSYVAHGGSLIFVGVITGRVSFDDAAFHKREMRVLASRNALKADFETVIDAFERGLIDAAALCSEILTLGEVATRLPELAADRSALVKAVVAIDI